MGLRRGLRQIQLWEIQLDDLRVRADAERVAVAFSRFEHSTESDAAARPADADPKANKEALSKTGIRP